MAVAINVTPLLAISVLVSILVTFVLLIRRKRYVAFFKDIPGPKGYPIIGNALEFLGPQTENYKLFMKYFEKFGDIYQLWIGTEPFVLLGSAEAIQPLLSSTDNIEKPPEYKLLEKWLGTGLLTSRGEKWHHRRKILTPSFHMKLLESFIHPASAHSDLLVQLLRREVGAKDFEVKKYMKMATLDIAAETTMGCKLNAQINPCSDFLQAIDELTNINQRKFTSPWLHIDCLFNLTSYAKREDSACKVVHGLRNTIVKERRAARKQLKTDTRPQESLGKSRLSLLDFMLEVNMSDEDIGEEVDTFIYAAHDTISTTVCWSLYVFAQHKDVQVKILKEFEALANSSETKNPFSVSSINNLTFLDRCVKEVMRLYTPAPLIGRTIDVPMTIENHYLPAGTKIAAFLHAVHMNPRHYPNPEKFDPDRFLPDASFDRHPFAYIPFSAGIRNCIGKRYAMLVLKIILIKILQAYEISTSMQPSDLKMYFAFVLCNEGEIKISLQKRSEVKS